MYPPWRHSRETHALINEIGFQIRTLQITRTAAEHAANSTPSHFFEGLLPWSPVTVES